MKITLKHEKHQFSFHLPLIFIKTKMFMNLLNQDGKIDVSFKDGEIGISFKEYYHILKDYVKKNGHFNLVEIESDNSKIIIRI